MEKFRILLLSPTGSHPSSVDQSLGARPAAIQGPMQHRIILEEDYFPPGDLEGLERTIHRWAGKVAGVIGITNVAQSTRLGKLAQEFDLLCFVSNNNPAVWQGNRHIFHIGVPTAMTSSRVAELLLRREALKRIAIIHSDTEFQGQVASSTESSFKRAGAKVRSVTDTQPDGLQHLLTWRPDLFYLAFSKEELALPLLRSIREASPDTLLLVGRSLLRQTFIAALGKEAEGLLLVDLFHRGSPQRGQEATFFRALDQAKVALPTANHGFGWDAMTLCGLALAKGDGRPLSAIEYLESGIDIEGATGQYRFSTQDHNGRAGFNPTILSQVHQGRVKAYEPRNWGKEVSK